MVFIRGQISKEQATCCCYVNATTGLTTPGSSRSSLTVRAGSGSSARPAAISAHPTDPGQRRHRADRRRNAHLAADAATPQWHGQRLDRPYAISVLAQRRHSRQLTSHAVPLGLPPNRPRRRHGRAHRCCMETRALVEERGTDEGWSAHPGLHLEGWSARAAGRGSARSRSPPNKPESIGSA